jgi:uncharacterized protein YbaR (Trm112 family)
MFIELTDHLRCPVAHAEQFLVLLPDEVRDRRVIRGSLGCPVCGRVFPVTAGIARLGAVSGRGRGSPGTLNAEAAFALLGLSGPGGFVGLLGEVGRFGPELAQLLPHVHFALINPPGESEPGPATSIIEADRLPLKSSSMRGIVVGADYGFDPGWVADAVGAVLPGLRAVVAGLPMDGLPVDVLASAPGAWVGKRVTGR